MSLPKTYAALAALQAGDAVACALNAPPVVQAFDDVGVPPRIRWIFPVIKGASAVGLLAAGRYPALGRLTTALLTVYFVLAVGAHVRVHDKPVNMIPAAGFLATFAVLTAKGTRPADRRLSR
ncbi:DoxX family protein [Mycobacterium sp. NPDC003449]